jgi:hypothetical protein
MAGRTLNDLAAVAVNTKVIAGKLGLVVLDTTFFFVFLLISGTPCPAGQGRAEQETGYVDIVT